jgi:hypothetical protein
MRPYMPFMAALVLFGAVACGASSSSSSTTSHSSSSSKPTAAQKAAALDKATCLSVSSAAYATKTQAKAYINLLEVKASQAGVDNTLAGDMMNVSTILTGHESGVAALTTARVAKAQTTLKTDCQKWTS